jgi:nucleoside-diphosphate-sugar epimerase
MNGLLWQIIRIFSLKNLECKIMKIFVTGSTGFIGSRLAAKLASEGHTVHALYRSEKKIARDLPSNILPFKGDLTWTESIEAAIKGCDAVIHTAAFAGVWHRDEKVIYDLNVASTVQILKIAAASGVRRTVVTSSAAVFGPSGDHVLTEADPEPLHFFTPYERSKALMEKEVARLVAAGQDIVIVNPTRLYGPGPLNDANSVTRLVKMYCEGKWHFLPGNGESIGNYVFVDDVVNGLELALLRGRNGHRYILGGENVSYREFFLLLEKLSGVHHRLFRFPLPFMLGAAGAMTLFAKVTGIPPMITPGLVRKYNHHWKLSSDKAKSELGYDPLSLEKGLSATLQWLRHEQVETNMH